MHVYTASHLFLLPVSCSNEPPSEFMAGSVTAVCGAIGGVVHGFISYSLIDPYLLIAHTWLRKIEAFADMKFLVQIIIV